MTSGSILDWTGAGSGLLAELNALQRLHAASGWAGGKMNTGQWVAVLLVVALLGAGVIIALGSLYLRLRQLVRFQRAFRAHAGRLGLGERERRVLWAMARAARLRNPERIFTSTVAFESGEAALMESPRVTMMSEARRAAVAEIIESLRGGLDLRRPEFTGAAAGAGTDAAEFAEGEELHVVFRGEPAEFAVQVRQSAGETLLVEPTGPVECVEGEGWLVRYSREGTFWEIDATVQETDGGRIRLSRRGRPRHVNRRRFPRVPTQRHVQVAKFPFWRSTMPAEDREFVDGELVEIAGPGLRIRARIELTRGERVLVAVRLGEGRVVEALGRVVRATNPPLGPAEITIELQNLDEEEVAALAQATNSAAIENARRSDEPAGGEGETQAAGDEEAPAEPSGQSDRPDARPVGAER